MNLRSTHAPYICARCVRAASRLNINGVKHRSFTSSGRSPLATTLAIHDGDTNQTPSKDAQKEEGAMSQRLSALSEANLEEGGSSAQKLVEEAGFDEALKNRLLERIAGTEFQNKNRQAFAQAELRPNAAKEDRANAIADPWTGTESVADASLRMLNDAYKPLKRPTGIPRVHAPPPKKIDTGRPKNKASTGARLANARDRSSRYSYLRDESLTKEEKDQFRKELKDKFTPAARATPTTLRGLTSLANERIEDAIARGQFKNLPRGQKIERDYNASSPFLDTTEYFMNKIIQRQDIVPPWIEKQQEVVSTANKFRSGLRAAWRRHAARLIASKGGSLESQIARAQEYARAEAVVNPTQKKTEKLNAIDDEGQISQISLSGKVQVPLDDNTPSEVNIEVTEKSASEVVQDAARSVETAPAPVDMPAVVPQSDDPRVIDGAVFPFRDPHWEGIEYSYHKAAIENLNTITRSYNLMAPNLAKKPYFTLERELKSCYADVAPQLADEIYQRARAPRVKVEVSQAQPGGVLEKIGGGSAQVFDERRPQYGFKEFWKDIFGKKGTV